MRNPYISDWIALAIVALIAVLVMMVAIALLSLVVYAAEKLWRWLTRR